MYKLLNTFYTWQFSACTVQLWHNIALKALSLLRDNYKAFPQHITVSEYQVIMSVVALIYEVFIEFPYNY
jgi:hypothetical protein